MERKTSLTWTIGSLAAMAAVTNSAGDGISAGGKKAVVGAGWLPRGETSYPLFKSVVEEASDFSWLKKGDSVFVKLAMNSGSPNPATSDPWALDCLLKILSERGAGKIYAGDHAGVRGVIWTAEQQVGSSRLLCQSAGLLPVIEDNGAIPVFFEERGYDAYIERYPAGRHHWPQPLQISSFVDEIDHIVYLPRIGSHILADYTAGIKTAVGFLREDSRRILHQGGADFSAMFAEINEVPEIKSKLRMTVSTGRKVMSLFGPDVGYVVEPAAAPVFASENLLAHDLFAYAYLQYTRDCLTPEDAADPTLGNLWEAMKMRSARNKGLLKVVWGVPDEQVPELPDFRMGDIYRHPAIASYIRLNSQENTEFVVSEVNANPDDTASRYLQRLLKI